VLALALLSSSLLGGGCCKANPPFVVACRVSGNAFCVDYKLAALRLWLCHLSLSLSKSNYLFGLAGRRRGFRVVGFRAARNRIPPSVSKHESTVETRRVSALLCGQSVVKM
jgi:hypothetical protein